MRWMGNLTDASRLRRIVCVRDELKERREGVVTEASLSSMPHCGQMPAIDEEHLGRMTLGDRSLEREVLEIFARQTALTLDRIAGAGAARAAAAAHTLKGSASGIGAWRVALAAERLEQAAASQSDSAALAVAIAELESASVEARAAIWARLGGGLDEPARIACGERSRDH
jgi:HPt (histidine-containing phosphotransfer) domain-containing protein